MSTLELFKKRQTIRTYKKEYLTDEHVNLLFECAQKSTNPYDIPIEYKLIKGDEVGITASVIVGTDQFLLTKMKRVLHAEEAFGYSFEKLLISLLPLGIGSAFIAGTMNRQVVEKYLETKDDEVVPCISPVGYPAEKKSIREQLMRLAINADKRKDFEDLFFENDFDTSLTKEKAGQLSDCFEAVRLAPSAINRQPWRLVLAGKSIHFYLYKLDGINEDQVWDVQKIDIGIALYHFKAVLEELNINAKLELTEPNISKPENTIYIASWVLD